MQKPGRSSLLCCQIFADMGHEEDRQIGRIALNLKAKEAGEGRGYGRMGLLKA